MIILNKLNIDEIMDKIYQNKTREEQEIIRSYGYRNHSKALKRIIIENYSEYRDENRIPILLNFTYNTSGQLGRRRSLAKEFKKFPMIDTMTRVSGFTTDTLETTLREIDSHSTNITETEENRLDKIILKTAIILDGLDNNKRDNSPIKKTSFFSKRKQVTSKPLEDGNMKQKVLEQLYQNLMVSLDNFSKRLVTRYWLRFGLELNERKERESLGYVQLLLRKEKLDKIIDFGKPVFDVYRHSNGILSANSTTLNEDYIKEIEDKLYFLGILRQNSDKDLFNYIQEAEKSRKITGYLGVSVINDYLDDANKALKLVKVLNVKTCETLLAWGVDNVYQSEVKSIKLKYGYNDFFSCFKP